MVFCTGIVYMEILQIVLLVLGLILIIYFFIWAFSAVTSKELTKMMKADTAQTILANTLPTNSTVSNYSYSMWIYVNDWNTRFGSEKIILTKQSKGLVGTITYKPSPRIALGAYDNTLAVTVECYPTIETESDTPKIFNCTVENIPIQKWVNILVSLYGRTLDIYLDGKLVRTCILPGVAKITATDNILITPGGGFDGFTTNIRYMPQASSPQQAYDIYKEGLGGSILSNILNKFRIRFTFLQDNKETGSFEI